MNYSEKMRLAATTRLNTEEFIRRSRLKHGDKYDYSKSEYVNWTTKVVVICPEHGEFWQQANAHMSKNGCPKCNGNKIPTKEMLIEKCGKVHENKYDYSKSEYTTAFTKTIITCPEHGDFEQFWSQHKRGQGCPKCAYEGLFTNMRLTKERFVENSKSIFGDKYDYSKAVVESKKSKVIIICHKHGEFIKSCAEHTRGKGCPKCIAENRIDDRIYELIKQNDDRYELVGGRVVCKEHGTKISINNFIGQRRCKLCNQKPKKERLAKPTRQQRIQEQLELKHNSKYLYPDDFGSVHEKIRIICPIHGEFYRPLKEHIKGRECVQCTNERLSIDQRKSLDQFILEAKTIHQNRYSYERSEYVNSNTPLIVECPKHGEFFITPGSHLINKCGCPQCSTSLAQIEILNLVKQHDPDVLNNDRQLIKPYEVDILSHKFKLAIEYNGLFYHSYNRNESTEERRRHIMKTDLVLNEGYKLLQFFESEYNNKKDIIESMILNHLGASVRVFARKCEIRLVDQKQYRSFTDQHHLQGYNYAEHVYGLYYCDELISLMSFKKHQKYEFELMRYVTKSGYNVVGGASRLFKAFIKEHNPKTVMSFADRRYSTGDVYKKLGFEFIEYTKPNYFYTKGNRVFSRINFQKHKLQDKLEVFDPKLTESANMFVNGYRRFWDAGHNKLIWTNLS